jgi:hypothetical protein
MWTAIEIIAVEGIRLLSPPLSKAQEEFFFEGFLVVFDAVLKYHYRPEVFPSSQEVVEKVIMVMSDFCAKLTPTLTDANNFKILSEAIIQLHRVYKTPGPAANALSQLRESSRMDITVHPAQSKYFGYSVRFQRILSDAFV